MVHRATVGKFDIISLQVWTLQDLPARDILPKADAKQLGQAFARDRAFFAENPDAVCLTQNIFVVCGPGHNVLVDTGLPLERAGTILQWGLKAIGLEAGQIDLVFLTHRDNDHVGGTVGQTGEPLYPKARYLIGQQEYQDYKSEARREQEFAAWIRPLEQRGVLELLEGGSELSPGLSVVSTPGHRSGATSLRVQDGNQAALILADTLHLPLQVTHPEVSSAWDSDLELAARTRRRVVEEAEHEGLLLAVPHTPRGGLGHVQQEGGLRFWSPLGQTREKGSA